MSPGPLVRATAGRTLKVRPALGEELAAASTLCLRSKAYWGYSEAFLEACVAELTIGMADLARDDVVVAADHDSLVGVAQVSCDDDEVFLEKLFVDPDRMGEGAGRMLFAWALDCARARGADTLVIDSDPNAGWFYQRMGCTPAGTAASESIPGRQLPRFVYNL